MTGYQLLANAIIEQAAKDYRKALCAIQINENNRSAQASKNHLEKFFLSEWFRTLTDVNGTVLISKLKEECGR